MLTPIVALSLLLAPAGPPPDTWQTHDAACRRIEDETRNSNASTARPDPGAGYFAAAEQCRQAFEAAPGGSGRKAIKLRSYLVFEAHRLYQLAHDAGNKAALCVDVRVLDSFAAQLAELTAGEQARNRSDTARVRAEVTAQLAAPCPDSEAETTETITVKPARDSQPRPVTVDPVPPPAADVSPAVVHPVDERMPVAPTPERTRRPLRIVGGAALGLGLGLGAAMIGAAIRGATLRDHADATRETYKGQLIPDPENTQFQTDVARGHRADHAAIGLGVAGGVLAVVGVALVVVDARRGRAPRRVALQSSVLPTAGIRLTMEF